MQGSFSRTSRLSAPVNPGLRKHTGPPRIIGKKESSAKIDYSKKWSDILLKEATSSSEMFKQRLSSTSEAHLKREGLAIDSMSASIWGTLFDDNILSFYRLDASGNHDMLPFHRFQQGDVVVVSKRSPIKDAVLEGIVMEIHPSLLKITTKDTIPNGFTNTKWRLDKSEDLMTITRCLESIQSLTRVPFKKAPEYSVPIKVSSQLSEGLSIDLLPLFIDDGKIPIKELAAMPPGEPLLSLYKSKKPPADFAEWNLNESQMNAIRTVPQRRLSLIKGPPGTGKTSTAIRLIQYLSHFLKGNGGDRNYPILTTAFTNIGVDNILEGLLKHGLNALRIGAPTRVKEDLRKSTIEARFFSHSLYPTLEVLRRDQPSQREKIENLERTIISDIVLNADVICSTCIGASMSIVSKMEFPVVIIDECTQATEPSTLCPIVKGCKQLVLLGDDFQLGPVVVSQNKEVMSTLSTSFFQRMINSGVDMFLLNTQYRMSPHISYWPSKHFYKGLVKDGISKEARPIPKGFYWPRKDIPVAFVPCLSNEHGVGDGSKVNTGEASVVKDIVNNFIKSGIVPESIGIVTPYSGQIRYLVDILKDNDAKFNVGSFTESVNLTAKDADIRELERNTIKIHSVDGFQGREKDIIIFSAVRSNAEGNVGFLSDWRRMNVALTRARNGLIVIGNPQTLSRDEHWNSWIKWAKEMRIWTKEEFSPKRRTRDNSHERSKKKHHRS